MADNNPHIIRSDQPLPLPPKEPPPAKPNDAAWEANGHANDTPADAAPSQSEEFLAYWHGDVALRSSRPWTVHETIPEVGAGLLAGQWGTYKTFTAMDLACAVMSGTPIFGSEVDRRGGVLLYAAEGENEVQIRIQASIDNRCPELTKAAPFTWLTSENFTLNLLESRGVEAFIARAQQIDAEMKKRFGLPLALVIIDTLVATAGFTKSGDENDAVLAVRLMTNGLGKIARKTGTFVLGVDHFGKNVETGTRGASAKEDNSDVVLATLGEKSMAGVVTNPRLAVRKTRGGVQGREYAFSTRVVDIGVVDTKLRPVTTLVIDWSPHPCPPGAGKNDLWPKSLRLLKRTLTSVLADLGTDQRPYPDGPLIRAVDEKFVRTEYYKNYAADGDTKEQKQDTKRKKYRRSIENAQERSLIGVREIDGVQYVWLAQTTEVDPTTAESPE